MKRLLWIFAALGMLCSCSKEEVSLQSDDMISIAPVMGEDDVPTRASLYKSENELRADLFHTYVYFAETSTRYFSSDAIYSTKDVDPTKHRWLFYEPANDAYNNYYWPLIESLDFFAYAPVNNGYVEMNYQNNPPSFTATMPLTNTGSAAVHQDTMKEFMYAYVPDQNKSTGTVPLVFRHPFAAIVFKVQQSHRDLTVKTITVNDIEYKGTCSFARDASSVPVWSGTATGDMQLSIDKVIPGEVNFGGELGGPYLVLPQDNSSGDANNKNVDIKFTWPGTRDSNWEEVPGEDYTYTITGKISNDWTAGKIYTYTVDLGNSREEILFEVSVTDWDYVYEHVFEIE